MLWASAIEQSFAAPIWMAFTQCTQCTEPTQSTKPGTKVRHSTWRVKNVLRDVLKAKRDPLLTGHKHDSALEKHGSAIEVEIPGERERTRETRGEIVPINAYPAKPSVPLSSGSV